MGPRSSAAPCPIRRDCTGCSSESVILASPWFRSLGSSPIEARHPIRERLTRTDEGDRRDDRDPYPNDHPPGGRHAGARRSDLWSGRHAHRGRGRPAQLRHYQRPAIRPCRLLRARLGRRGRASDDVLEPELRGRDAARSRPVLRARTADRHTPGCATEYLPPRPRRPCHSRPERRHLQRSAPELLRPVHRPGHRLGRMRAVLDVGRRSRPTSVRHDGQRSLADLGRGDRNPPRLPGWSRRSISDRGR